MQSKKWLSRGRKLGSLAAVGAGAVSMTVETAQAGVIVSDTLNTTIGFSSNSQPTRGGHTAAAHLFNTFAGGPIFGFKARSFGGGSTFSRSVTGYNAGFQLAGPLIGNFAGGAEFNPQGAVGNGFAVGRRNWGSSVSMYGSAFTDRYLLFRFAGTTTVYGWIEASLTLTRANNSFASNGPNLTIIRYAYDDSGALLAAGDTGAAPTPEPATLGETGAGALILGAEGLRRWRKARKQAQA